ncbi:hypothetical protein [Halocalculus aciditolerans]|uniref:Uncharacterized protein n=1 Tax=Halocalculus aciditolerans TaxID=1383812 RepID=A0A830F9K5_9EURY|nr:hypothetical protein [Halocalculus aciditolerans]GGL53152.1 hypothetical protein GCM10009039_09210 [Halocalculus aciditolerans]
MRRVSRDNYVRATALLAALATVGLWLPWVTKLPAGYTQGQPYYTMEWVAGLDAGFQAIDVPALIILVLLVVVVAILRSGQWSAALPLLAVGALSTWLTGNQLLGYRGVERYAAQPGLYLLVAASLGLFIVGVVAASDWFRRKFQSTTAG